MALYAQKQPDGSVVLHGRALDDTWVEFTLPDGETDESNLTWIDTPLPIVDTVRKAEANKALITAKATEIIESKYTPLKQRKLLAMLGELQQKKIDFLDGVSTVNLTAAETDTVAKIRQVNAWVGSIRTIENDSITLNTPVGSIDWGAEHTPIM